MKIVFLHIYKTAGTALREMLKRNYKDELLEDYYHHNFKFYDMESFPVFVYPNNYKDYNFIIGHFPIAKYEHLKNEGWKFVTWLREPVERFISHYHYDVTNKSIKKKFRYYSGYPIEKYIKERGRNTASIMLGDNLDLYDFVGFQDRMEESVSRLNIFLKGRLQHTNMKVINKLYSNRRIVTRDELSYIKHSFSKDIENYKKLTEKFKWW